MRNIRLIISYDGSRFFGWQKTASGASIQETVEDALRCILREPVSLEAASRTDRGVHARGQSAHFLTENPIDLRRLKGALNALLLNEISIQEIEEMPLSFHPTLDAMGKEYRYFICNRDVQLPMQRLYSWHIHTPLDLQKMRQGAQHLIGKKDFAALSNERLEDSCRTIYKLDVVPLQDGRLRIDICGDNFLYKMARNIAGALVYAGLGKLEANAILKILLSRDRRLAAMTAPAHGLFLWEVYYEPISPQFIDEKTKPYIESKRHEFIEK